MGAQNYTTTVGGGDGYSRAEVSELVNSALAMGEQQPHQGQQQQQPSSAVSHQQQQQQLELDLAGPNQSNAFSVQTIPEAQLDSIVNVTREYPFDYAIVMFGYLLPVVLFVTIVTNLLVVAVLYQRHMRTPTNIVLFTMAIVDLATLLSPSPWYLYIYTFGNHNKFLYPPIACYAHHIMTDVVPVFFHTSSIWLALLLASQRYIYVCHPTLARTWCTVPRVKRAIIVILVVAFLHQLTRFFDNTFVAVEIEYNHVKHMACKNGIADWVQSIHVPLYYTTYFTFRILFVFIIPCSALITLNWLLFRALKRAETKRTQLLKTKFRIVGAEASQADRNLSVAALGAAATDRGEVSSYATAPAAGATCTTATGQSCLTLNQRGLMMDIEDDEDGEDDHDVEVEDDDEDERDLSGSRIGLGLIKGATSHHQNHNHKNHNDTPYTRGTPISATPVSLLDQVPPPPQTPLVPQRKLSGARPANHSSDHEAPIVGPGGPLDQRDQTGHLSGVTSGSGTSPGGILRGESLRSGSSASSNNSDTNTTNSATTSKTDDLSTTCPECAAYEAEMRRACGRCSSSIDQGLGATAIATTTNTSPAGVATGTSASCEHHRSNYHRHLLHQPMSQCSSILGGVTNTTTNEGEEGDEDGEEDISSCLATQNISGSMFVAATIDGVESSSMRGAEDDDEVVEPHDGRLSIGDHDNDNDLNGETDLEDGCSHQRRLRRIKMVAGRLAQCRADSDLGQVIKSGSVESRLACGCLAAKTVALRRARSLGKRKQPSNRHRLDNCKLQGHSCVALEKTLDRTTQHGAAGQQVDLGGSRSNSSGSVSGRNKVHHGRDLCPSKQHDQVPDRITETPKVPLSRGALSSGGTTSSGRPHSKSGCNSSLSDKLDDTRARALAESEPTKAEFGALVQTTNLTGAFQPATATTTLYSANTSSASSLIQEVAQVKSQSQGGPGGTSDKQVSGGGDGRLGPPNRMKTRSDFQLTATTPLSATYNAHRTTKSPSFASCTTGRGSRATLLGTTGTSATGSHAMPMIVSGQQNNIQATIPVSARSMDSNRTTLMLVVVVTVFLFVEVPVALMTIAHVVLNTFDVFKDVEFISCLDYIKLFTNFMIMISYSVNFTIYCSMSKRFRETFRDLFHCLRRSSQRKRTKRLFSQSQAPHCTQINTHHFAAASTVMTSAANHNQNNNNNNLNTNGNKNNHANNNNNNYLSTDFHRPSKQFSEQGLFGSGSSQHLLGGHLPRARTNDRLAGQQSECEL